MDNEFQSSYVIIRDKRTIFNDLKKSGDQASNIYLATDPDREGEAISWHLQTFSLVAISQAATIPQRCPRELPFAHAPI